MPKASISLRDPRVVLAVAVLLIVVVAVNLHAFLPARGAGTTAAAWDDAAFTPPADLLGLTRTAVAHVTGAIAADSALSGADSLAFQPDGARDPFRRGQVQSVAPRRETAAGAAAAAPLACTAVMPGGSRPAALINGVAYHLGDPVAGYRVAAIDINGVRLSGPRGQLTLAVRTAATDAKSYAVVTGPRPVMAEGSTELERADGSRKP